MKWHIEGADAQTGEDRLIQVEADSEEQATRRAARQGLLVSSVFASAMPSDDPLDVAMRDGSPGKAAERAAARRSVGPSYDDILKGAGVLNRFAMVIRFVGLAAVAIGILHFVLGIVFVVPGLLQEGSDGVAEAILVTIDGVAPLVWGLLIVLAASLVRWCSSIGLAIREIAVNSRRAA